MKHRGKKYTNSVKEFDRLKKYSLKDAVTIMLKDKYVKFDEAVDIAFNLGIDPKQSDQMVRGAAVLPHGLGKKVRVIVITKGEKVKEAEEAGADFVGLDELLAKINGGWFEFDKVVATPDVMGQVGKLGKVLGTRGLMPNPKLGTVTFDLKKAVTELKAGRTEFRVEKAGIVHATIGRVSFGGEKILDNAKALVDMIMKLKPQSSKGIYVKKMSMSSTMGHSIRIDVGDLKNFA